MLTSRASISEGWDGTPVGAGMSSASWRGRFLTAAACGGGNTISGHLPARLASAFRQPATCSRPVASTNENSSQTRRPNARRLPKDSCDSIATIRERAASPHRVRLIWDCAMMPVYEDQISLSRPFCHDTAVLAGLAAVLSVSKVRHSFIRHLRPGSLDIMDDPANGGKESEPANGL